MSGTESGTIDVVVVNWNAGPLLRDCLASLAGCANRADLRVVVIDNASHDGSADGLAISGLDLTVVRNRDNRGFARACNQGAALGRAQAVLFLNPDTSPDADSLATARAALMADPGTGIVGARLIDGEGRTQRSCARTPGAARLIAHTLFLDRILPTIPPHFMLDWDHAESRPVDAVMGAFLMIRRPLFERLGGFDERFFVYWEDADLCTRAGEAGLRVRHVAQARVHHRGQGTTEAVKDRRLFYFLRAQALYAAKHHGRAAGLGVLATAFLVQLPIRFARALVHRAPSEAAAVWRAGRMLLAAVPGMWPLVRGGKAR